jgi:preprotein translocase subunit SecA
MMDRMGHQEGEVIQHPWITKSIERAQKKVEENNFGIRKRLLEYDDVMNAQREVIYKRRRHALHGDRIRTDIANMFYELVEQHVLNHQPSKDFEGFRMAMLSDFGMEPPMDDRQFASGQPAALAHQTFLAAETNYRAKCNELAERAFPVIQRVHEDPSNDFRNILVPFTDGRKTLQVAADIALSVATEGKAVMESLEKSVVLAIIDQYWKEHLRAMDELRSNVQHARFEQKDPLIIYKSESFKLFEAMVLKMNEEVASFLMMCTLPTGPAAQPQAPPRQAAPAPRVEATKAGVSNLQEQASTAQRLAMPPGMRMPAPPAPPQRPVRVEPKVLPNDPCPCGSGQKYKKCHGA